MSIEAPFQPFGGPAASESQPKPAAQEAFVLSDDFINDVAKSQENKDAVAPVPDAPPPPPAPEMKAPEKVPVQVPIQEEPASPETQAPPPVATPKPPTTIPVIEVKPTPPAPAEKAPLTPPPPPVSAAPEIPSPPRVLTVQPKEVEHHEGPVKIQLFGVEESTKHAGAAGLNDIDAAEDVGALEMGANKREIESGTHLPDIPDEEIISNSERRDAALQQVLERLLHVDNRLDAIEQQIQLINLQKATVQPPQQPMPASNLNQAPTNQPNPQPQPLPAEATPVKIDPAASPRPWLN